MKFFKISGAIDKLLQQLATKVSKCQEKRSLLRMKKKKKISIVLLSMNLRTLGKKYTLPHECN